MIPDPAAKPVIAVGSGGENPRMDIVDPDTQQRRPVLSLGQSKSVYTAAISRDGESLAAGTKAGTVYVVDVKPDDDEEKKPIRFIQGAPVLSLCFAGPSRIASSDTAGRCLLWNLSDAGESPASLETGGRTICALAPWDSLVAGLTLKGQIITWERGCTEAADVISGPGPPSIGALVRLVPWPEAGALAYPSETGELCLLRPELGDIEQAPCHDGEFYALTADGEKLITAGYHNGKMKMWGLDMEPRRSSVSTGGKTVAVATMADKTTVTIFLVDKRGRLNLCSLGEDTLRVDKQFGPAGYRTVVCLRPAISGTAARQEVRITAERIRQHVESGNTGGLDNMHLRLRQLGFEHISLKLRAEQARHEGHIPRELRRRKEAVRLLPDKPESLDSLTSYARLCRRAWRLEEALLQRRRIADIDPSFGEQKEWAAVRHCRKAMEGGGWLAGPTEMRLGVLAGCASVLDQRFTGRWIINTLRPLNPRNKGLEPEDVARKYRNIRQSEGHSELPGVRCERVSRVTEWDVTPVEALTCEKKTETSPGALQFCLLISRQSTDTLIIPAVVFSVGQGTDEMDPKEHNTKVAERLEKINDDRLATAWLNRVREALMFAVRRLITPRMSPWSAGRERE